MEHLQHLYLGFRGKIHQNENAESFEYQNTIYHPEVNTNTPSGYHNKKQRIALIPPAGKQQSYSNKRKNNDQISNKQHCPRITL